MELAELEKISNLFEVLEKGISNRLTQTGDLSHLQNYLKYLHAPVASFTDAVITLSRKGRHNAAKVLLRSLIEAHIQNSYYQASDTEARLALAAKKSFESRLSGVRAIQSLIGRFPSLESTDPNILFNRRNLQRMIDFARREIDAITRANPNISGKKEPRSLEDLAKECDRANLKGVPRGHYECMYALQYRFLSPVAHLNVLGLEHFFELDPAGKTSTNERDDEGLYPNDAVNIYVALVRDLYDEKVLTGTKPDSLLELEGIFYSNEGN